MYVTIRGKRWRLEFGRLRQSKKYDGHCDPPRLAGKTMMVLADYGEFPDCIWDTLRTGYSRYSVR